jgi:hypothetical protein
MMTTLTICLFLIVVAVIVLVALKRGGDVLARCKLLGVDFSIHARDRRRDREHNTKRSQSVRSARSGRP